MTADLFALAARRVDYLAAREALLAQNVAGASTPGYRARDAKAFDAALDHASLTVRRTDPRHLDATGASGAVASADAAGWEVTLSGNTVTLEQELAKLGDTQRAYGLATSVTRGFQRMALAGLKA